MFQEEFCPRVRVDPKVYAGYCLHYKERAKPLDTWSSNDWGQALNSSLDSVVHDRNMLTKVPKELIIQT